MCFHYTQTESNIRIHSTNFFSEECHKAIENEVQSKENHIAEFERKHSVQMWQYQRALNERAIQVSVQFGIQSDGVMEACVGFTVNDVGVPSRGSPLVRVPHRGVKITLCSGPRLILLPALKARNWKCPQNI